MVNVTETDHGHNTTASVCFSAELNEPLLRDAFFDIIMSDSSTSVFGVDYTLNISSLQLVIPSGFSDRSFNICVAFVVFGNDRVDGNRSVLYNIQPQSSLDSVYIPYYSENSTYLVVHIFDDEERKLKLSNCMGVWISYC